MTAVAGSRPGTSAAKFLAAALAAAAGQAWAQVPVDLAAKLREMGPVLDPAMIQATFDLYAARVPKAVPGVSSSEDLAYGPDERQRLDVFAPAAPPAGTMPVVLFVPGGDKK